MTPAARVQAAIELLDAVISAAQAGGAPADRIVSDYFRQRRYAGSKDRRAVREMVYAAIRACGPVPASGRAAMLRLAEVDPAIAPLFDGSTHGPAPISTDEPVAKGGVAPDWLAKALSQSGVDSEEAFSLLDRAPLDVRVNALKADRDTLELPEIGERLVAPQALRYPAGTPVEQWDAFKDGRIEVQDLGSQLACLAVPAAPGETVIDLCAGAGGKTLALAAAMDNRGTLLACDSDRTRLSRLVPRAERAGAGMIETRLLDPGKELAALDGFAGKADTVLVDAPCSGTGTWRRSPEGRWRLTPERLARFADIQSRLLEIASQLVQPGGRLVFITCSLLDTEGSDRIEAFLAANEQWSAEALDLPAGTPRGKGLRLSQFHDGTDGFFIARLARAC
ncbi:RsmB/NOP family class I SAM-dependent RNA methyltransferase [Tsuneonella mangrovi]|uniref:RsmB/NOP family class I SAM-dependent RNA methyltransferase n=1 Tax=Tsuneonella mangrovi TaxID=1982042 RepID=UPI000BA26087|nr:RsmB/NOP family class I SAM-dependent RNA methyltransferase [Tsuneonella mangrovi]